jgi:hypothetical protein
MVDVVSAIVDVVSLTVDVVSVTVDVVTTSVVLVVLTVVTTVDVVTLVVVGAAVESGAPEYAVPSLHSQVGPTHTLTLCPFDAHILEQA